MITYAGIPVVYFGSMDEAIDWFGLDTPGGWFADRMQRGLSTSTGEMVAALTGGLDPLRDQEYTARLLWWAGEWHR